MKKTILFLAVLLFTASMAQAAMNIVTTLPWIGSITQALGKDKVNVTVLVKPSQDPHFLEAKPSFILAARQADALLYNGLDLEVGYLPLIIESSRNAKIQPGRTGNFDCSRFVTVVEKPASVDRSLGDVHPLGNPHYQYSPKNVQRVAEGIAGLLTQLDGNNAAFYKANLQAFNVTLKQHQAQWAAVPLQGKRYVAYHKSYEYLVPEFGIQIVDYIEAKPGIPPSSAHVEKLLADMQRSKPAAILFSPYQTKREADYLSGRTGVKVSVIPHEVGALPGTGDWFEWMDKVVEGLK